MNLEQFKQPVEDFLQELRFNGMSEHTRYAYQLDLQELFKLIALKKEKNEENEKQYNDDNGMVRAKVSDNVV